MSLIEIRNLRKAYPNAVPLDNVSVNIDAGEEGKAFSLAVDARALPWNEFLAGEHDDLAEILLRNLLKRMPDQEPGVAVFARQ